jgi:hypothetical protein
MPGNPPARHPLAFCQTAPVPDGNPITNSRPKRPDATLDAEFHEIKKGNFVGSKCFETTPSLANVTAIIFPSSSSQNGLNSGSSD